MEGVVMALAASRGSPALGFLVIVHFQKTYLWGFRGSLGVRPVSGLPFAEAHVDINARRDAAV